MIENSFAAPLEIVLEWYRWGVAVAFAITLVATLWIFFDSTSKNYEATIWRVGSLLAALVVIPSAILGFFPELSVGLGALPVLLAILGMIATIGSLIVLVLYTAGIGVHPLDLSEGELEFDSLPALEEAPPSQVPTPVGIKPAVSPMDSDISDLIPEVPLDLDGETQEDEPEALFPLGWIVLMDGHRAGQEFRLRELIDIGRDSKHNDVSIDDPAISRQHARVRQEEGFFVLYDLASANGIMVNGETVQRHVLQQGDRIVVGQNTFGFMHVFEENDERDEPDLRIETENREV